MQVIEFDRLDELAEMVSNKVHKLYEDGTFSEISKKIKDISKDIEDDYSISVDFQVNVFDTSKEKSLRILTIGICSSGNNEPYLAYGDATRCRYLVDGHIKKVPHDFCPNCWEVWDFKLRNHICPGCGYEMGNQIKLLLDTDVCPNCEKGKVSIEKTQCDDCGFVVDRNMVNWG